MGWPPRACELLGLAAWIGELTKLELGEGELGLRRRIGLADSACHAHGLAEALGGESPFGAFQPPLPAQTVEIADGDAVLARFG